MTVAVLAAVGLALWAIALAALPLPPVTYGFGVGTCGPGYNSESALAVRANPSSVNAGDAQRGVDTSTSTYQQEATQFEQFCLGTADARLELVGVLLFLGLIVLVSVITLVAMRPAWL